MKIKAMIIGATVLAAGALGAVIPVQTAAADAYHVVNGWDSKDSVSIWNKKGCMGASEFLRPGENSSVVHLWKTIWVPRHRRMHFVDMDEGVSYFVDNRHDWKTCHSLGRWFSVAGWEVFTTKY